MFRSDAQRAQKQKERKEKELELCAFNAEQIEDSHHTHSLVCRSTSFILYSVLIRVGQGVNFSAFD